MTRPARHDWSCHIDGCVEKRIYVKEVKNERYRGIGWIGTKCGQVTLEREPGPEELAVLAKLKAALS